MNNFLDFDFISLPPRTSPGRTSSKEAHTFSALKAYLYFIIIMNVILFVKWKMEIFNFL